MANSERHGKAAKLPSRAASLQRMLEIERKQKMERMQLQTPNLAPAPGRRGVSPASQASSSASSRASGILLHRRRDSSQPRQQPIDDQRMSTARNFTLPPLSIHTQPKSRVSLMPDLAHANLSDLKIQQPQQEPKKPDRNTLPSMVRAATAGHEHSSLSRVVLASEEGNETDGSSICHSPTWDDYGKKKRKKEKKEFDAKRKRLTKGPPPAAMEPKPAMGPPVASDTTLTIHQLRQSLESGLSSHPLSTAPAESHSTVPVVETVPRSPGFIGGVRLDREREAAMQRMTNRSAPSVVERPASEVLLRGPPMNLESNISENRRDAVATVYYPPTSSKSRPPVRLRRNSLTRGLLTAAGKLFHSRDKDAKDRSDSRASAETDESSDRGRKMSGSTVTHSRGQSYDTHDHFSSTSEQRQRGPPSAWKNTLKKTRTTSMMAVPPDSAREGSFPRFDSPELKSDNFDFLDRPFSPPTVAPVSPVASLSASVKAKMSPSATPTQTAIQPLSTKKTFKEALRAGFTSSSATSSDRRKSETLDTLVGNECEMPLPKRNSQPLESLYMTGYKSPDLSAQDVGRSDDQQIGQAHSGDSRDSRASSASSHPYSESVPGSPMTTPEGSRPHSKKENQTFRLEEIQRAPPLSYENVIGMRGSPTLPPRTSSDFQPKKAESPRTSVERPMAAPRDLVGRQQDRASSKFIGDVSPTKGFLTDEFWSQNRRPIDPDQLSFTSALTSLDVKRSCTDLDSTLHLPNSDITPLSLEDAPKDTARKAETEARSAPMGFQFGLPTNKFSSPSSPRQASASQVQGRIPSIETSQRNILAWRNSPSSPAQPVRKASDYLEEARKAAPASPRAPTSSLGTPTSLAASDSNKTSIYANPGPRTFPLSQPKPHTVTTTTTTITSSPTTPKQQVQPWPSGAIAAESPLGAPISKMLVECCHCKFYHDMPSRVYEAMARPDDVVKDKRLGVSGQVTMCVKCPWCSHNMSTVCCAGYAAVVYLREKLHGP